MFSSACSWRSWLPPKPWTVTNRIKTSFRYVKYSTTHFPLTSVWFQEFVGYSLLSDACKTLLVHQVTSEKTLGCILSLSFHDFGLVDLFTSLGSYQDFSELEIGFLEYAPSFGTIRLPHVFKIAWDFMACSLTTSGPMRMLIYKILEHLTQSSHHNLAVLAMTGILTPLFSQFTSSPVNNTGTDSPSPERRLLSKILKRLFEMGASAQDVRQLLQCAVNEDGSLDAEMIEFLRIGMKSSWPSHVSLSGSSVVAKPLQTLRTLPSAGFAFTVSIQERSRIVSYTCLCRCGRGLRGCPWTRADY